MISLWRYYFYFFPIIASTYLLPTRIFGLTIWFTLTILLFFLSAIVLMEKFLKTNKFYLSKDVFVIPADNLLLFRFKK